MVKTNSTSSDVKVMVRIRPNFDDSNVWVSAFSETTLQTGSHRNTGECHQYSFEHVFSPEATQMKVFSSCVKPMLTKLFQGQNASVFAYGPTGAGKTHTILGSLKSPGLIPRTMKSLFQAIEVEKKSSLEQWTYSLAYSYLEIYNEKVYDLLDPRPGVDLPMREDNKKNINVVGLCEKTITSLEDFNKTFGPASNNRTTAATKLNERSSRSHSILQLKLIKQQTEAPFKRLVGKLYIIDLAGSEDNRRTGNEGIRLKESGAINSSLLALGQVVNALEKKQTCIPYRASKLTRLLQDSLGGNAHSVIIVNIAPEEKFYFETNSTLKFARKAKKVVNLVTSNESTVKQKISLESAKPKTSLEASKPTGTSKPSPQRTKAPQMPFLSPLIRNQEKMKFELREELIQRLEVLETRLLHQMNETYLEGSRMSMLTDPTFVDNEDEFDEVFGHSEIPEDVPDITMIDDLPSKVGTRSQEGFQCRENKQSVLTSSPRHDAEPLSCSSPAADLDSSSDLFNDSEQNTTVIECKTAKPEQKEEFECITINDSYTIDSKVDVGIDQELKNEKGHNLNESYTIIEERKEMCIKTENIVITKQESSCSSDSVDKNRKRKSTCNVEETLPKLHCSGVNNSLKTVEDTCKLKTLKNKLAEIKKTDVGVKKNGKVFSDGSREISDLRVLQDLSNSPLFINEPFLKKKFKSTASSKSILVDTPIKKSNIGLSSELQETHNNRILQILKNGSLKEILELQTVGKKRASLILDWRQLKGEITKIQDLKDSFGTKQFQRFLVSNLIVL